MAQKERARVIVRVHRPELSTEERAMRMAAIERAAANLIKAAHIAARK